MIYNYNTISSTKFPKKILKNKIFRSFAHFFIII